MKAAAGLCRNSCFFCCCFFYELAAEAVQPVFSGQSICKKRKKSTLLNVSVHKIYIYPFRCVIRPPPPDAQRPRQTTNVMEKASWFEYDVIFCKWKQALLCSTSRGHRRSYVNTVPVLYCCNLLSCTAVRSIHCCFKDSVSLCRVCHYVIHKSYLVMSLQHFDSSIFSLLVPHVEKMFLLR